MVTRIITTRDRDNARRLRTLWDNRKKALGLTQAKAAEALGLNHQSTVSQYLNCDIAMNTDIVLKFAQLLDVDPAQIDPQIRQLISAPVERSKHTLPVSCQVDLLGEHAMAVAASQQEVINPFEMKEPPGTELRAVEIGTNAYLYAFGFPHNANVMVLVGNKPEINDVVFIRQQDDTAGFYRFSGVQKDEVLVTDPLTSRSLTIPVERITEMGTTVGWLANDLERRKPWPQ